MESLGTYLRQERELRQMSLEEISQTTRIPLRTLQRIEDDDFEPLPGDVFTRGFLKSYARSVGLDTDDVLERHARRNDAKPEPEAVAPISSIQPAEGGRRFGIAIALVILLILFTLALSIVMRPRHRDTPIELSNATDVLLTSPAPSARV
ncbi:MAG: helix-turn-helix domain-containing protein [Sandaracinaceae bacterium]|nr:helix-turn-helix domain-containing protein [Sandaracinaceae bacterium]